MTKARSSADYAAGGPSVAGKNFIINGGFDIWQRSTSASTSTGTYPAADRFWVYTNSGSATMARESTVIPDGARYSAKITATGAGTQVFFAQAIETSMCTPFIGKTVTVSGQLAASTSTAHTLLVQYSTTVDDSNSGSWTTITASTTSGSLTPTSTTFVSFANTYAIPSNAKTVRVGLQPTGTVANGVALYYGNLQLEVGSVATPFSRAGGTIQGELANCQRYLPVTTNTASLEQDFAIGYAYGTNAALYVVNFPVQARVAPTSITVSGTYKGFALNTSYSITPAVNSATNLQGTFIATPTITAGQGSRASMSSGALILWNGCEL